MMRGSVTSLVRTWPSTIMRRAAAKSVILRIPRACERRLLAASGGKRQGGEHVSSLRPREGGDRDLGSGFPLEFTPAKAGAGMSGVCSSRILPPTVARRESLLYSRPGEARGEWLF